MDADFSHDPRHLPVFLVAIKSADLVIGSRYIPGGDTPNWSLIRRLISGSGNIFARFVLQVPVQDCTGGFRCYRRHALEAIDLDSVRSRGYAFQVEMTYRVLNKGFTVVEVPIIFVDRRLGQSKMSRSIILEAFTYVLKTRFSSAFMRNKQSRDVYVHQILPPSDMAIPLSQGAHRVGLPEGEPEADLVRPNVRSSSRPTWRS